MDEFIVSMNTFVINRSFTDFDALTDALQGWNLELHKLDASPFTGDFFQLVCSDLILSRARFNSRLRQVGEPPPGYRTFAVLASERQRIRWRGKVVDGNDLFLFPPHTELHASTESGFHIYTISIRESTLHRVADQLQLRGLDMAPRIQEVFHGDRQQMNGLRQILRTACDEHELHPTKDPEETSRRIAMHLIHLITAQSDIAPHQPTALRQAVIQKVERYIFEHPEDPPTIPDLSSIAGVSMRTLGYAFNEYYGLNTKAYINAIRLNAVRKQLRGARPAELHVADAANAWGFWHMGQFAADYRKLFGENPSNTLGCDASPCERSCTPGESPRICER